MKKQGFQKGHAGRVPGAWDMGRVGNLGASPTCHHPRPRPGQTHSRLPPRSLGSTMFSERLCAHPRVQATPGRQPAPPPPEGYKGGAGAQPSSGAPMYTLTLILCLWQTRPQNSSSAAAGWVLAEKPERAGYEPLSRPPLRARMGQPLGPTCASCEFQKPAGLC